MNLSEKSNGKTMKNNVQFILAKRRRACNEKARTRCAVKFVRRVYYRYSVKVNLNFANRKRARSHDTLSISSIYMRAFRAISDRSVGIITLFMRPLAVTFYSKHNSPGWSFLIREVEDRWCVVTAKSRHDYSTETSSQVYRTAARSSYSLFFHEKLWYGNVINNAGIISNYAMRTIWEITCLQRKSLTNICNNRSLSQLPFRQL